MSAKKSWDIAPRASKKAAPVAASSRVQVTRMNDVRRAPRPTRAAGSASSSRTQRASARVTGGTKVSTKNVTLSRAPKARVENKESLRARRRRARIIALSIGGGIFALLLAGLIYLTWLTPFRVVTVSVRGLHDTSVHNLTQATLQGTHAFIIPRNSIFFIPERDVRARILEAHPDIESVIINADGFTALSINTTGRAEVLLWCGAVATTPLAPCFSATADGFVFAESATTGTETLRVFAPLADRSEPPFPGARMMYAEHIPPTLRMVKAMQTLGAPVTTFAFRDDEVDLYTRTNTRITYVLGREQEAAATAASAFPQLTLTDDSLAYIDLRFAGKAYYKQKSEGDDALDAAVSEVVPSEAQSDVTIIETAEIVE